MFCLGLAAILSTASQVSADCGCSGAAVVDSGMVVGGGCAGGCGGAVSGGVACGGGVVDGGMGSACAPQVSYVEKTVMVPQQTTETRMVTKTLTRTEARTRTYTVSRQVPRQKPRLVKSRSWFLSNRLVPRRTPSRFPWSSKKSSRIKFAFLEPSPRKFLTRLTKWFTTLKSSRIPSKFRRP